MTAALKRKLAEAQTDTSSREMTALRALRLSVARVGDDLFGLALGVVAVRQARMAPDDLETSLSDTCLTMLLDCAGGLSGAVSVAMPLVTSVIQQQTIGHVIAQPPVERDYTDTDAAMCAPLIEEVVSSARDLADAEADKECFRSVRFGARAEDVRTLLLALRAKRYRVFWITLDIALGKHQAEVILILPEAEEEKAPAQPGESSTRERSANSRMLNVPAELKAVLMRFRLPMAELNALKVGDHLPIPREKLSETLIMSVSGQVVARGKLGQMNGNRAVRLMRPTAVPRIRDQGGEVVFEPHSPAPSLDDRMIGANELKIEDIEEEPLSADSLAALSPDEAAEQISALAGLDPQDQAQPVDLSTDLPSLPMDLADFPPIDDPDKS